MNNYISIFMNIALIIYIFTYILLYEALTHIGKNSFELHQIYFYMNLFLYEVCGSVYFKYLLILRIIFNF